jgi:hypothetical protein
MTWEEVTLTCQATIWTCPEKKGSQPQLQIGDKLDDGNEKALEHAAKR